GFRREAAIGGDRGARGPRPARYAPRRDRYRAHSFRRRRRPASWCDMVSPPRSLPPERASRRARTAWSRREEALERLGGLFGRLLGKEMAAVERVTADIVGPRLPQRERSRLAGVPRIDRARGAPEGQQRTRDPTPGRAIRL